MVSKTITHFKRALADLLLILLLWVTVSISNVIRFPQVIKC